METVRNHRRWRELLEDCRDHHDLRKLCDRHAYLFSRDDRKWITASGVDGWPRIMRLLRQEIRAWRGQPHDLNPDATDRAYAAVRRIWRPWRIHTAKGAKA